MTSSPPVFRSGLLLTCNCLESVFIWYHKLMRGPHKCCLCFSESFHVCNQLVSVTWGSDGCHQSCLAPRCICQLDFYISVSLFQIDSLGSTWEDMSRWWHDNIIRLQCSSLMQILEWFWETFPGRDVECTAVRLLRGLPYVSLFEEFAIQFGGEAHCGFSGLQTWLHTNQQKKNGSYKCLSFNPPLNFTTVSLSWSHLPAYSFEFVICQQFISSCFVPVLILFSDVLLRLALLDADRKCWCLW